MPTITPIHNIEISYLLDELEKHPAAEQGFDQDTRRFIASIRAGEPNSARTMQRNLEIILHQLPDDGQGLRAGERAEVSDVGALGHAFLSSRNLRSAHKLLLAYRKVLRTIHDISIVYEPDYFIYSIENLRAEGRTERFFVESFLTGQQKIIQTLLGPEARLDAIRLAYDPPAYKALYEEYFRCPVYFKQERSEYVAPAEYLDRSFSFANDEVKRFCELQCRQIIREMEAGAEIVSRAREALLKKPGWFPHCDELARELGFSPRTFRRRLQEEDSNFQSVIESVRKELSANYLNNTDMTVEMIAYRLGYEEANSFYKAFRRWYGTTPKAYSELN